MRIRTLFVVVFVSVFLGVFMVPFKRTSQGQIAGGDSDVILITRKAHLLPREFHSTGGMNPINFWSHLPDPTFESNEISSFQFKDEHLQTKTAFVQGFNINRVFANDDLREDILAVRVHDTVFEYSTPNFLFANFSLTKIHFIGQKEKSLTFFFGAVRRSSSIMPALVVLPLPLDGYGAHIIYPDDMASWAAAVSELRESRPSTDLFKQLCEDRSVNSYDFVKSVFDKSCDSNP